MNMKRMRGRNHRPNGGGGGSSGGGFRNQQNGIPLNRNHVFDSSGPEMRVRGTAQQLYEKYQQLARDASSNGDRVTGEAYYQHAEHYFRIISAINQAQGHPPQTQPNGQNGQPYQNGSQGGHHQSQDRNGNYARPEAEPQQHNGQQNGQYNNQNRRYEQNGERQQDLQLGSEPTVQAEARPAEPQRIEARPQENRQQENRSNEGRTFEPRRHDQRNRSDFQRNDRNNDGQERPRPEGPVVDTRIDISSALEAELAATVAEPAVPATLSQPEFHPTDGRAPVVEARAIPIIPDAPPPASTSVEAPAAELMAATAVPERAAPKPRGRPKAVKPAPKE